jgi:carboxylesterase
MSVAEIGRTSEVGMPLEKFTKKLREDLSVENSYIPNAQAIKIISNPNSKVAILMIHGFTGSVASISPWVKTMAAFGFNVCAPLLPGHGTTWKNLNQTRWQDWFNSAEEEFKTLRYSHQKVFIAGFSMGGALALRLAQIYGNEVSGLILINPSIEDKRFIQKLVPLIKYFVPRTRRSARKNGTDVAAPNPPKHSYGVIPLNALASLQKLWKLVGQNLYLINQPLLLGISPQDHVVNPDSVQTLLGHINSVKVTQIEFPNSFHNVALDYDLEKLCIASRDFINELAG